MSRPLRSRNLSSAEYIAWSHEQVLLACQIEDVEGLANCKEIVNVAGIDIVQTGRNDLALSLGVPGETDHPKVREAEKRIIGTTLEAGKQVSLMVRLTNQELDEARQWVEQGVRILTIDSDYQVLIRAYQGGISKARALSGAIDARRS
jgi:2-keto-3-deoxy-L-rhamnonate aldolase RhmA